MISIEEALENVTVHDPGFRDINTPNWPKGWYAVSTDDQSIIAYFCYEGDAFRYRLSVINDMLNGTYKF